MLMFEFDGSKLEKLRKGRFMSRKELAVLVGKQPTHIWNYEKGKGKPPADVLLGFLTIFKVPPVELSKTGQPEGVSA